MFKFFKRKSKEEILEEKYKKLMKESYELSTTNRSEADKKYADAQAVMTEMENLRNE
jgi:hypothetical protein